MGKTCLILLPPPHKPELRPAVDFDTIHDQILALAAQAVGFRTFRASVAPSPGGTKPALERFALAPFAIVDLTFADATLFHALGAREAMRPHTTVLIRAKIGAPVPDPFDVFSYALDAAGQPSDASHDRARLSQRLAALPEKKPEPSLFDLLDGQTPPQVAHEKADLFRQRAASHVTALLKQARESGDAISALDHIAATLGALDAEEGEQLFDLFLAYRDLKAWDRMITLYEKMDAVLANTLMAREQYAFALNRAGRGGEAGDVGDGVFGQQQALLHQLVKKAVRLLLVGADSEESGVLNRRLLDQPADLVEVDRTPGGVRLHAKGHQNEANGSDHEMAL
jgi:hypothetical protein